MDPLIQAQCNIRHNADELQSFLRDLNQWKDEMNKKEKEIGEIGPVEQNLPPIRGSKSGKTKIDVVSKNKKNKNKGKEIVKEELPKLKRIASYDYNAWEKYDADKACDEVDSETEKKESEEELSEEEDMEVVRRREEAAQEKEKGNDFFRLGKIDSAIECYTKGMLCDPTNPFLPANRALALLKKEMYAAAEQDCDLALLIDKNYVKAFQRRGIARLALKKVELAKEDFRKVLDLEPGNRQAYDELMKIKKIEADEKSEVEAAKTDDKMKEKSTSKKLPIEEFSSEKRGIVKPITKPPHLRSKKPMKRIKIKEITTKIKVPPTQVEIKTEKRKIEIIPVEENIKVENIVVPGPPQNLRQFQSSWKMLKKYKEKIYQYLKQIPCDQYVTIFDDFLEAEVLSDFLLVMEQFYLKDDIDIFDPLTCLTNVKRFQIVAMFFSEKDKKILKNLFYHLITTSDRSKDEIAHLASLYQITL